MKIVKVNGKTLAFLPTWRLVIVIGMYCAAIVQVGAWIIFTIEQKPMHPAGKIALIVGSACALLLGRFIGKEDVKRIREEGAMLEVTRLQIPLLILCCAAVPVCLLILVIISGI
jgi:fucose permease